MIRSSSFTVPDCIREAMHGLVTQITDKTKTPGTAMITSLLASMQHMPHACQSSTSAPVGAPLP